jgi:predicted AAA+ superfamily ATPase
MFINIFFILAYSTKIKDFEKTEESHLMENIIYNELRYRGFNVDVGEVDVNEMIDRIDVNGKKIYKKKSSEVDFIATSNNQKY